MSVFHKTLCLINVEYTLSKCKIRNISERIQEGENFRIFVLLFQ